MTFRQAPSSRPAAALRLILGLALRVGPLRTLVCLFSSRRFVVEGASMEPTLAAGQYLLISRAAYWLAQPQRGDIVVVRDPRGGDKQYIKRVVALPGEQLSIRGGRLSVEGQPLEEPYLNPASSPATPLRDGEWLLGAGEYLVLGDNRGDSLDSRAFGPVLVRGIVGKAGIRYWPPAAWGRIRHGRSY